MSEKDKKIQHYLKESMLMEQENEKSLRLKKQLEVLLGSQIYSYLNDDSIFEVIANPDGNIFLKTTEGDKKSSYNLPADKRRQIINQIAGYVNIVANTEKPLPAAEFFNMRFQGFLPPIVKAPAFNIRKHSKRVFLLDEYVQKGIMTERQRQIILKAVKDKKNIVVAGGTGSGKTTLLNAILAEISQTKDRVVIIEKEPELQCIAENRLSLQATDEISMDALLKATLRATPDRIIVGEVRGGEALTLLDAWNTGHNGGASTIHANSAKSTLTRLNQLVARVLDKNTEYVIGEAVDIIIYIECIGVQRKIDSILKVVEYDKKTEEYILEELV